MLNPVEESHFIVRYQLPACSGGGGLGILQHCCCCFLHFHTHEISLEIPFRWSGGSRLTHSSPHSSHTLSLSFSLTLTARFNLCE